MKKESIKKIEIDRILEIKKLGIQTGTIKETFTKDYKRWKREFHALKIDRRNGYISQRRH